MRGVKALLRLRGARCAEEVEDDIFGVHEIACSVRGQGGQGSFQATLRRCSFFVEFSLVRFADSVRRRLGLR